ncbi:SCO family protein [Ramlibacter sp. MAHUQ-53]|uniref:SCO family protein n=1 Tax=unclassified Ramlibacter TaxID=2617605 RepID=UPI00364151C2
MSGSNSSLPDADAGTDAGHARQGLLDEPLQMSVHSLPVPGEAAQDDARRTRSGRWKMLAVLAVCAAPVIASYFTYYVIRPEGRRNFGELVEPQRPLPALTAITLDGAPVPLPSLKGQWLLVSVSSGQCGPACENHLYLQRQLREILGKDKDRLDRVWLIDDMAPVPEALKPGLRESTVLRVDGQQLRQWLAPAPGQALADHLYVVDPMGNWMMRFPAGMDREAAAKAKRDLERLMRASAGWDEAGRK